MTSLSGGVEGNRHSRFLLALAVCMTVGCGGNPDTGERAPSAGEPETTTQQKLDDEPAPAPEPLRPPPCPPDPANCERAAGTILYVERVDPDGDGDAHFVLLSGDAITAPGISIIDVRRDLRPDPLPGPGERLAAAGPVYPGSRGQLQIEAVAVRTEGP